MRTTLSIDDDVFTIARQRARREHISIGEAMSRYVREALRSQAQMATTAPLRSKYSVLPARGETITTEHVRRLMHEEGI
jgi:hypothetical protein